MSDAKLDALEAQILALTTRVEQLEAERPAAVAPGTTGLDLALLERLSSSIPADADGFAGACTYAGSLRRDGAPLVWQRNLAVPGMLDTDVTGLADVLAAAGHPDRLAVLRALCAGPRASTALAEAVGAQSAGKLYHHLDKLQAVGLVRQVERGTWELPDEKVVPVLVLLGVATDLSPGTA